ncbi:MAG: integrin alpha, partial [Planctomycetota bacterium]
PYLSGGHVFAYSSRTGALLWDAWGEADGDEFGLSLSWLEDRDGDGLGEVLVGAPGSDRGAADAGAVYVLSGDDGSVLQVLDGALAGDRSGSSLATLADLDDDGFSELAVGVPGADPGMLVDAGKIELRGGADLSLRERCPGAQPGDGFGSAVAAPGDVDADGHPDLVGGAALAAGGGKPEAGSVFVCATRPLPLDSPKWTVSSATGGRVEMALDAGPANASRAYVMLGSASGCWPGFDKGPAHVPLNIDAFFHLALGLAGTPAFEDFVGTLDGDGRAVAALDTQGPFPPIVVGLQLHFAFVLLSPIDTASNALPIELMP